jgi:hypothetical protein
MNALLRKRKKNPAPYKKVLVVILTILVIVFFIGPKLLQCLDPIVKVLEYEGLELLNQYLRTSLNLLNLLKTIKNTKIHKFLYDLFSSPYHFSRWKFI